MKPVSPVKKDDSISSSASLFEILNIESNLSCNQHDFITSDRSSVAERTAKTESLPQGSLDNCQIRCNYK